MPNDPTDHPPGTAGSSDRGLKLRMASEARRVHSQHQQIAILIADLHVTFEKGTIRAIRSAFEHFADAFDAHMRVEETLYFPALHGLMPEVDPELIALSDEHRALRSAVEEIRGELASRAVGTAKSLLDALAAECNRHEAVEESLIERVRRVVGNGHSNGDGGR